MSNPFALINFFLNIVLKRVAMKPNCLLIYSPTHPSHVNVMAELTKYLRYYNINAMIDMFDIAETANKVSNQINQRNILRQLFSKR